MDLIDLVTTIADARKNTWKNKPQSYWLLRLILEVAELTLSLLHLHKHKTSHELIQITSICINWMRQHNTSLTLGKDSLYKKNKIG